MKCGISPSFFEKSGATTMIFSKGADSVDFALVNRVLAGDIVITQDYGLAAISKNTIVIDRRHGIYRPQSRVPLARPPYGPEKSAAPARGEGP
ncbi:MAG: DUF188 domain-containing protein [Lawsonibacter sp.]|nr:DUF188 domain-containing protein [Lawsonibacter sp.]